jgi:hypothetical protein
MAGLGIAGLGVAAMGATAGGRRLLAISLGSGFQVSGGGFCGQAHESKTKNTNTSNRINLRGQQMYLRYLKGHDIICVKQEFQSKACPRLLDRADTLQWLLASSPILD